MFASATAHRQSSWKRVLL